MKWWMGLVASGMFASCSIFADPVSDATKLKNEALEILKANANREATPAQYATCIYKLEQAQQILEKAKQDDTPLAQEVSSTLFWSRRFSDMNVIKELEKLKGGAPQAPMPVKKPEPAKPVTPPKTDPDEPSEGPDLAGEAKKAFQLAEKFAREKSGDDYAVALRWFQMANEHSGTDYALKALDLAQKAQARFAAKTEVKEVLPDTPEYKILLEADAMASDGKYEQSFALYMSSLKLKETVHGHRKLGHAYFKRAQQIKDEFMPEFEQTQSEYRAAWKEAWTTRRALGGAPRRVFNPNYPPLVEVTNKQKELLKKAQVSIGYYRQAESEFKNVLKMAPNGKDLDAAGHAALCLSVQADPMVRSRAKMQLNEFLSSYKPVTDMERSLYEFCKTELKRIVGNR